MTLRLYLFSLYMVVIVSAGLAAEVVLNVNPFTAPFWVIAIFYVSVFLFLTSLFGLIFFYWKVRASNREVIFSHLKPTLRQAMFLALVGVTILLLQQIRILNWWVSILLILAVILVELSFRGRRLKF